MARKPLVVAVAQPECVARDVAANTRAHAAMVRAAGARLVVFPELSLTGYELDAPVLAAGDPRLAPLHEACADTGSVALAGAPVAGEDGRPYIAMLAIDGGGTRVAYRKMWLGSVEAERFSPGPEPAVIELDDWRIGLAICKDTGTRQHATVTAARGIDVYAAGVLETASEAPLLEKRARRIAMEHGVWVAVASFAGSTGGGYAPAAGRSAIWSPDGLAIAEAGPEVGALARAVLGFAVRLRPATPSDVPAIVEIWHLGWRDGHLGHVPDALLAHRRRADFEPRVPPRLGQTTVAVLDGVVAGFVIVHGDEVEQVYVAREARGRGVADALLRHAEDSIGRRFATAWLAVVAGNARARRFYERSGWRDAGPLDYAAEIAGGSLPVPSRRYEKPVGEAAAPAAGPARGEGA